MTKDEIKTGAYKVTSGEFAYDGFTATQWREIGDEGKSDEAYEIAKTLDEMNEND